MSKARKIAKWSGIGLAVLFVVIQLVPIGRNHDNPAVSLDAPWPDGASRALAVRACYDCHSNETQWPWYSNIAPVSWFVQHHVDEGRDELNFSEWDKPQEEIGDAVKLTRKQIMPLASYLPMHPEAKLSDDERKQLIAALKVLKTTAKGKGRGEKEGNDGSEGEGEEDDDEVDE